GERTIHRAAFAAASFNPHALRVRFERFDGPQDAALLERAAIAEHLVIHPASYLHWPAQAVLALLDDQQNERHVSLPYGRVTGHVGRTWGPCRGIVPFRERFASGPPRARIRDGLPRAGRA